MKTVGAKELRNNLDQIFERVLNGEDIKVNHRFKGTIKLSSAGPAIPSERLVGLKAFEKALKKPSPFKRNKPIKEIYHEHLDDRY